MYFFLRRMRSAVAFVLVLGMGTFGHTLARASQEWIPAGGPQAEGRPAVSVLASDETRVDVEVSIPGLYREMVTTPGGEFPRLSVPPEGFTAEIGRAQLPVIARWVEIPAGAKVELEAVAVEENAFSLDQLNIQGPIAPVQPPVPKIPGAREAMEFEMDESFYNRDHWYPLDHAELAGIEETRGHRLVLLKVYPVRYNPGKEEVSICWRLRLRIHLHGGDLEETNRRLRRWHSST